MGKNNKANMYVDIVSLHNEVTGSCNICTVRFPDAQKVKFIVDCGLFQEEKYQKQNYYFPFNPNEISFLLVTHNHIDHIGRIPKLYKDGFKGKTYASKITSELMPLALNNTAEILSSNSQKNNNKQKKNLEDSSIPTHLANAPLFEVDDVANAMENVIGVEYNKAVSVAPHIAVKFIQNGHLLGAASILVTITYKGQDPIYLFFSGDYANENVFFDIKAMPKMLKEVPLNVITESTYGTRSRNDIVHVFEDNILESLKNKETLIIPVFSLGRSQEMLLKLKKMQKEGKLSKSIPIYLDGKLSHSYTSFYQNHLDYLKQDEDVQSFLPENLTLVTEYETRQALLPDRNSKIILTTSGMGSYGPAQFYLPYYISRPKCTIHFCGYTTPNTFGSKIKEVGDGEVFELNGIMTTKKAKVLSTNEFSGHGKQEDLLELLEGFNLKSVLINHGEENTKVQFAKTVIDKIKPKGVAILSNKNYIRVGAHGILKSYPVNDLNFNITD